MDSKAFAGRLVHIKLGGNPELGGSVTRPPTLLSHLSEWCWRRMARWMQLLGIACAICFLQSTMALASYQA